MTLDISPDVSRTKLRFKIWKFKTPVSKDTLSNQTCMAHIKQRILKQAELVTCYSSSVCPFKYRVRAAAQSQKLGYLEKKSCYLCHLYAELTRRHWIFVDMVQNVVIRCLILLTSYYLLNWQICQCSLAGLSRRTVYIRFGWVEIWEMACFLWVNVK